MRILTLLLTSIIFVLGACKTDNPISYSNNKEEKVKNYDGSWIEWIFKGSKDNSVPILKIYSPEQFPIYKIL